MASPLRGEQMFPPVLDPEHVAGAPFAVEQKDEQTPGGKMRHVLPLAQSLARLQDPPGGEFPVGAQTAPLSP